MTVRWHVLELQAAQPLTRKLITFASDLSLRER